MTELYKEPFQLHISPKKLARLISKQDGDGAASTQVLSHYGDFGAPRLRAPVRRQTCDRGRLDKDAENQRLRGKGNRTMRDFKKKRKKEKRFCRKSTLVF